MRVDNELDGEKPDTNGSQHIGAETNIVVGAGLRV